MTEEIARLIIDRQVDERLKWNKDGTVRVQIGKILPEGTAVRQTLAGRRRRIRAALDSLLNNAGWRKVKVGTYAPHAS